MSTVIGPTKISTLKDSDTFKKAKKLSVKNPKDLLEAAKIIKSGGIIAFPFNGIFGLFGDIDDKSAAEKIINIKKRPKDKKLIMVVLPEHLHEVVDTTKIHHDVGKIQKLLKKIHALGLILPAATTAPYHLVERGDIDTILTIWTEYLPLRIVLRHFRKLGGRAFVGTSANKSGQPTHNSFATLWNDFENDLDAIIEDNFDHLDPIRRKSTTVIDITNHQPRLHRLGNVYEEELDQALADLGFPTLVKGRDIIVVQGRD